MAVAPPGDESGWIKGAPLLAVEYAGAGRDESCIAEAILVLLADRGLAVSLTVRERIMTCRDRNQLMAWLLAVARVEQAERLFD